MPKTSLGWWSFWLVIGLIVLIVFVDAMTGPEVLSPGGGKSLDLPLAIILAGISAAAFVTGLIGIVKRRKRAILVFLTTAIGLFALIIAVREAFGKTIGW